jgi:hypothetical protein
MNLRRKERKATNERMSGQREEREKEKRRESNEGMHGTIPKVLDFII